MPDGVSRLHSMSMITTNLSSRHTAFDYRNRPAPNERFTALYETAIDNVPGFDSEVVVFGEDKTDQVRYPFRGGLGITIEIDELMSTGTSAIAPFKRLTKCLHR